MELYDIRAGRTLRTLPSVFSTGSVAFSPDGRLLAIGNMNYVVVWNIANGRRVLPPFTGHQDYVTRIAFTFDGKTLLTGSQDRSLRLWNLATGQQVATVPETYSFTLSSDGSTLAVYTHDWLRLIHVPPMAEFDQMDGPQGRGR